MAWMTRISIAVARRREGVRGHLHNCQCISHADDDRLRFYPDRDKAEALQKAAAWLASTPRAVNPDGYGRA